MWLTLKVLPSNRQDDFSHVAVLDWGHLANFCDQDLVDGSAEVFFVMCMEVAILTSSWPSCASNEMGAGNSKLLG